MVESLITLLNTLNTLSPLAVIALLAVILFTVLKNKEEVAGKVDNLADNHLHDLPEVLATLQRIEIKLSEDLSWIKAKLNGRY